MKSKKKVKLKKDYFIIKNKILQGIANNDENRNMPIYKYSTVPYNSNVTLFEGYVTKMGLGHFS